MANSGRTKIDSARGAKGALSLHGKHKYFIRSSRKYQSGQAIVFGILFLGVVLMSLLILFNQGQLIKHRVQLENAADATAYTQAKLAARNLNFAAYTNRAMVANEVSIGQMVSLLSWAKHYKNTGAFVKYPAYQFPVAPPSPTTFSNVLEVITLPYKVMGTAVEAPTKHIVKHWPTGVSVFNSVLGVFQQLFSMATLAAQLEMNIELMKAHQFNEDEPEFYTPFIGWYFLVQNTLLTYRGEYIDASRLVDAMDVIDTGTATGEALVEDFFGGQSGELENFLERNVPKEKQRSTGMGTTSGADPPDDSPVLSAYKRYAAIVNRNREAFTADRHWRVWATTPDIIPEIKLDFGIVVLTIDLDFTVGIGVKNDGGTAYAAKSELESAADLEKLGWAAIDVMSMGVEFDIGLFVSFEVCLPIVGCSGGTLIDIEFEIPISFPLAGATHQMVSSSSDARVLLTDWGELGEKDGMFGGDSDDDVNDGPLSAFHTSTLFWGQSALELAPGMFGGRTTIDVTDSYGAPPGFLSIGRHFQEYARSYEFTTAVAKSLGDIETTDHDSFGIGLDHETSDWDDNGNDPGLTRFEVSTYSRAQAEDLPGLYQRQVWSDSRPMMTISAAEVYFVNPMQRNADGSAEPASLFSPFWDARLKEPSAISLLLATGELDLEEVFESLPAEAIALVNELLNDMADEMVDATVDYVKGQIDPPLDSVMGGPLDSAGDAAKEANDDIVNKITDELEAFVD